MATEDRFFHICAQTPHGEDSKIGTSKPEVSIFPGIVQL